LKSKSGSSTSSSEQDLKTVMLVTSGQARKVNAGAVRVLANVGDAGVYVNGKWAGSAPLRILLDGGNYKIAVRKDGYTGQEKAVRVQPDAESTLSFELLP
jgi:hypothetical protein